MCPITDPQAASIVRARASVSVSVRVRVWILTTDAQAAPRFDILVPHWNAIRNLPYETWLPWPNRRRIRVGPHQT